MEGISLTIVSSKGSDDGDGQESNPGGERAHLQFLFLLLTLAGLEQISVCLELEEEVGDVNEEKEDSGPTGDDEKTGSAMLLDDTRLAGLDEHVENVILNGLGHEVSGGNDERFLGSSETESGNVGIQETLTDARESHEGGRVLGCGNPEIALAILQTTGQERASQNEKQVGENGAKELSESVTVSFTMTSPRGGARSLTEV